MPVVPLTKLFFYSRLYGDYLFFMQLQHNDFHCGIEYLSICAPVWEKKKLKYYFQNLQFHNEYSFILPLEHNKSKNFTTAASLLIKIRAHRISSTVQPVDRNSKGTNFISNRAWRHLYYCLPHLRWGAGGIWRLLLKEQGACTMYTLSSAACWWRRWGRGLWVEGYNFFFYPGAL